MKLSFQNRVLATILFSCIICVTASIVVSWKRIDTNGKDAIIGKSRAILSRLEVGRKYVATQGTLESIVNEAVKKFPDGNLPEHEKQRVLRSVPIFASMQLGSQNSDEEHYTFRIFTDKPRNKDNLGSSEELKLLSKFRSDPTLKELTVFDDEKNSLAVVRPVRLDQSQGCLGCHGQKSSSPWGNGKDVLGYEMENWGDGYLHGAFAVISDLAPIQARTSEATMNIILWGSIFTFFAMIIGFLIVRRPIAEIKTATDHMKEAGVQVGTASNELASVSSSLSASASESAASLEETVSSLEELSSMVERNTENAKEAAALSQSSRSSAEKGEQEINDLIGAMSEISNSSKKVEEIINVIDDIAFQTNLLALNAAVEAARAGEQGKGFAVVADAVRNLAQRSADAAKEITNLIKDSSEKVEKGATTADGSAAALNEIVNFVKKVADLNNEIATASQEQSTGLNQINQAMNQLDKVTQQNAASAEEAAASSEEMSAQARAVQKMANDLFVVITGEAAATMPPASTNYGSTKKYSSHGLKSNVTTLRAPSKKSSSDIIPFDDDDMDDGRRIGNLSDF